MKTIVGLVRPSDGEILLGGCSIIRANVGTKAGASRQHHAAYRHDIGYMPQIARFQDNMTARELIRLIHQLRDAQSKTREEELCAMLQLDDHLDKPLKTLSGGTRQKVSAVLACMFRPRLLLLDEPTAGLDPVAASVFKDFLFQERNAGTTIILTSHVMSEVQELAESIVFLLEGRCIFQGKCTELLYQTGQTNLERAIAALLSKRTDKAVSFSNNGATVLQPQSSESLRST
jgi:Cu-processing system ATP-binding protein